MKTYRFLLSASPTCLSLRIEEKCNEVLVTTEETFWDNILQQATPQTLNNSYLHTGVQ